MKCVCCEREIAKDEKFYKIVKEFYCSDCVEEEIVTLYRINGGEKIHEDEVGCYKNLYGYIKYLNTVIENHQKNLDYRLKKNDGFSKIRIAQLKKKIEGLQLLKKTLLGDEEGEE